ncbi:MAG: peptidoglycan DD-metalloendopeptidase family protein [Aggregatilineales bacterium]
MQPNLIIDEPPRNPDDTSPTGIRPPLPSRSGSAVLRLAILAVAGLITLGAGVTYVQQQNVQTPTALPPTVIILTAAVTPTASLPPPTSVPVIAPAIDLPPAPDVLAELLAQPADNTPPDVALFHQETAFTIAPAGPRAAVIQYNVQPGDTLEKIAQRFNISQDTILWNNDIVYVNRLAVGDQLTILPIDGVLHTPSADETIQQMADKYKVSPYAIINSEYNHLQQAVPSSLIPANALQIMIPGGTTNKVAVYWKPTINIKPVCQRNCGIGTNKNGDIEFGGGPGSCGFQQNGGGDGSLGLPLSGYEVVRGFSSYHSGIDLAKPTGTPVFAAGTGTVIFAGWSDWGYGNSIVIAHTPTLMTLYGHLSQIDVSCGQSVKRGQLIGNVGSTGNSTGPHLHFEIRVNQTPVNPTCCLAF